MADDFRWVFAGTLGPQLDGPFASHADLILDDDDRVVVQTRGRGRTKRGDAYNSTCCMIFRVHGGELVEVIEHCDTALVERVLDPPTTS